MSKSAFSRVFVSTLLFVVYGVYLILLPNSNTAQTTPSYPQGYFVNPMDIPIYLAGNFGECRPNHFHTGIDLKTFQKENLPVRASADGFVSRISISHTGYGNALYIDHPNGYRTVYAHLNDFSPEIMAYMKKEQYTQQRWNIDVQIPAGVLPVKQSALIAYSGNTGGSVAPHLHFEIRDIATEEVINAALFGFSIKDNIAPKVHSIAIYDATKSIYNQKPVIVPMIKKGTLYTHQSPTIDIPYEKVRIGVCADDMMNESENVLGVPLWYMYHNKKLIMAMNHHRLDFSHNRYMNAYGDYKTYQETGKWYQGLYRLPYNELPNYSSGTGEIVLSDVNDINIVLSDIYQNKSVISLLLNHKPLDKKVNNNQCTYYSSAIDNIVTKDIQLSYDKTWIYEPTCIEILSLGKNKYSSVVSIGHRGIPLHSWATLRMKLNGLLPFNLRTKLIFIHKVKEASLPGAHAQNASIATYENGYAKGLIRTLGQYEVGIDTIAPTVSFPFKANQVLKGNTITFSAKEESTSIQSINAYINDQWICFSRKGDTFTYIIDEHFPISEEYTLRVIAIDESQNMSAKSIAFRR